MNNSRSSIFSRLQVTDMIAFAAVVVACVIFLTGG
jgi:hypothetical protein